MKQKILLSSVTAIGAAAAIGIGTAVLASDPLFIARMYSVDVILVLASMGLFFVGLVFPKS